MELSEFLDAVENDSHEAVPQQTPEGIGRVDPGRLLGRRSGVRTVVQVAGNSATATAVPWGEVLQQQGKAE